MKTMSSGTTGQDFGSGYLEISEKGFGFLRSADNHFQPKPTDIFVTPDTIKKNFLREGCLVGGPTQPPHRGTSPQLREVEMVNEMPFSQYTKAVRFENLTTIDPFEKFSLETTPEFTQAHGLELDTGVVAEAALVAEAAHEWHLTALELRADRAAGLLALAAAAGVRALAGARATADTLGDVLGALRLTERVLVH